MEKLPKGALRLVAEGCHAHVQLSAEGAEEQAPKLEMTAYSGQPILGHWYWGKLAIDLQGIKFDRTTYPVLEDHNISKKIAFSKKPKINGGLVLDPETTKFVDTLESKEFQKLSSEGFPFQASIYAIPSVVEQVERDESVEVNGYKFEGPGAIWRKCLYQEASVCVFGWDTQAQSSAFSKEEVDVDMQFIDNKGGAKEGEEENKLELKNKKGGEEKMPKSVDELKKEFPELVTQLSKDITTGVTTELTTKFDAEKKVLTDQVDKLSKENEENTDRMLKLEKKDIIRTENELKLTADKIWTDKLSASNVAEHLYAKTKEHVKHTKFTKDEILDVVAFSAAIDVEIKDWEDRGATQTVIGTGFSAEGKEADGANISAQAKSDDDAANNLLAQAGQPQDKT